VGVRPPLQNVGGPDSPSPPEITLMVPPDTKQIMLDTLLVYVDLYSACLRKAPQMRSDMDHTVLPANYTMPAFTPQPQSITALWLVLILPSSKRVEC